MRLQSFYYYRFFIIDRLGTSQSLMVYRKCENITYFRLLKAKLYAMSDNTKIHWISLKDLRTVTKKIVAYKRPFMTSSSSWGRYLSPIRIQTLLNIFAAAKDSDSSRRITTPTHTKPLVTLKSSPAYIMEKVFKWFLHEWIYILSSWWIWFCDF